MKIFSVMQYLKTLSPKPQEDRQPQNKGKTKEEVETWQQEIGLLHRQERAGPRQMLEGGPGRCRGLWEASSQQTLVIKQAQGKYG